MNQPHSQSSLRVAFAIGLVLGCLLDSLRVAIEQML